MATGTGLAATALTGLLLLLVGLWLSRLEDWRSYAPALGGGGGGAGHAGERGHVEKPGGLLRWLTTVDHKDVGLLYGVFATVSFAWGGVAVLLMRTELLGPGTDLIGPDLYDALMTSHGITMLFLFGTPILAAIGNYLLPLLLGADDMAFPRVNAIAFWLLPPGAALVWAGFFMAPLTGGEVSAAKTAWTIYTPLSSAEYLPNAGVDLMLLGLHLTGVSATMGAINFIATVFTERADDLGWPELDIFSWTMLTQSALVLFSFPLLGSAIVMLLLDRNLGTTFFATEGGGPLLWQHLFWFFGHPEVYILVIPPMGLVSYVLPKFSGRKLFGFKFVVYSTLALGVLSFGVWAHHMFTTGIDPRLRASFMAVSLAIAVPSAVKTFNWIATMWNGRLRLTAPMLFCVGFIANFIVGGVTGVFEAAIPVDVLLHDTYHVVAHFHYVIMGAIAFAVFAGIYYWFPLYAGRWYQRSLARWHFALSMVGTQLTFFPMVLLGYGGMPRRYATYLPQFADLHQLATLGAYVLAFGQLIFVWNVVQSWREGPRVESDDPWNLDRDGTVTREWEWHADRRAARTDGGEPGGDALAGDEPDGSEPGEGELDDGEAGDAGD